MHLNCHSYYSLRFGTLSPEELVLAARQRGIRSIALTDVNSTAAAFPFWKACLKHGVRPVLGIEFRNDDELLFIGLARNQEGWAELTGLLTECSLAGRVRPTLAPALPNCYVIYPRLSKPLEAFRQNEYLGVKAQHLSRLFRSPVARHPERLVAWSPFTCLDDEAYVTHRLLRAVDHNTVLSQLQPAWLADPDERLFTPDELSERYATHGYLLDKARDLLENCEIGFDEGATLNRRCFTDSEEGDFALVRKLADTGFRQRYGAGHGEAYERLERELAVIRQQHFCAYFLITWDITRYAKSAGYHHVGRGSGANSIVAYCMRISDVDPLELDLYFERFINPHRSNPPDFDIDFAWDERDDVIDYVFKRYGEEYTALLATTVTFRFASVVRELGKVFGLAKADIDLIVADPDARDDHHELARIVRRHGRRIANFPNYLSIHAGGILISERPLRRHTALQLMPKGFPIVHIDMYTAEDWGFHKYDILSQRGLGHIKDTVDLVRENQGKVIDIHDVARIKADGRVRARLKGGRAIGCFYIESPAMRGLLSKLRCDDYVHLVAASSIIRPGVAQSGMMRAYIERFNDPRKVTYVHPVFEEHLGETFGVMVYQEDVMKIAHHFSGLPMDECDILRRIMSGKRHQSERFDQLRKRYYAGCRERGHDERTSTEVWRQIESFAGYSFCKAHSASFAVESFQSLYLKVYYPLEFMVGVINNFGGFYRTEFYVHEARLQGANIHPPCVNRSLYLTTIRGKDMLLGFVHLRSLEQRVAHRIVRERSEGGAFRDLADFVRRVEPGPEQLTLLIRIGALRFTGLSKYTLMWEKLEVLPRPTHRERAAGAGALFANVSPGAVETEEYVLPEFEDGRFDQAFDELELLGFPLVSPYELLAEEPGGTIATDDFPAHLGQRIQVLGYFVTRKDLRTRQGAPMAFGTWLDRDGNYFDTTHFPGAWRHGDLRAGGIYIITGTISADFDFLTVDVERLRRLPYVPDDRYAG